MSTGAKLTRPIYKLESKLVKLQVLHYRYPLSRQIETTMGPVTYRPALVLRIEDEEGAYGWGEIWCNFPPDGDQYRASLAMGVLPNVLADLSTCIDNPFDHLQLKLQRLSLQAGEPGPIAQLCAGVDIAVHDLIARRKTVSIAENLAADKASGLSRSVKAYASGISPKDYEVQIERMRSRGFVHFKMRIGFGANDSIPELKSAASDRRAGESLMADANQAWSLPVAQARVKVLDPLNLGWLEEPLLADSTDKNWQALASVSATPLAAGENLRSYSDFQKAIELRALSVYQPDLCKWGGLSGCLEIAKLVDQSGQRYCPHYLGGGIGLLASAQLLSATCHDGMLEVDSSDNPLQDCLSGGKRSLVNGLFKLGDGPGLGLEPDIESAREFLVSDTTKEIK